MKSVKNGQDCEGNPMDILSVKSFVSFIIIGVDEECLSFLTIEIMKSFFV